MAITVLKLETKETPKGYHLMMFKTMIDDVDGKPTVLGITAIVDEKLKPLSAAAKFEIVIPEEQYHIELRVAAAVENDLITSLSTDPEWNPKDYQKNLDDEKN